MQYRPIHNPLLVSLQMYQEVCTFTLNPKLDHTYGLKNYYELSNEFHSYYTLL
jgi:hypothetical protein